MPLGVCVHERWRRVGRGRRICSHSDVGTWNFTKSVRNRSNDEIIYVFVSNVWDIIYFHMAHNAVVVLYHSNEKLFLLRKKYNNNIIYLSFMSQTLALAYWNLKPTLVLKLNSKSIVYRHTCLHIYNVIYYVLIID